MTKPMARKSIAVRVSKPADDFITKLAREHQVGRSYAMRAMLAIATQHRDAVKAKIEEMKASIV